MAVRSISNLCRDFRKKLNRKNVHIANTEDFVNAAVLVPVVELDGQPEILFEIRAGNLLWQPGEICFPGGKLETSDQSPKAAAVRETEEELGVHSENIEVLGELGLIVSPLGIIIYPYVGLVRGLPTKPNKSEVAEVFTVPLQYLLTYKPVVAHMELATRPLPDFPFDKVENYSSEWKRRKTYPVQFYEYKDKIIWGLTARVLAEFIKTVE